LFRFSLLNDYQKVIGTASSSRVKAASQIETD